MIRCFLKGENGVDITVITSRKNAALTGASALADKKERDGSGNFFCEGSVLLTEAASCGIFPTAVFLRDSSFEEHAGSVSLISEKTVGMSVYRVADTAFEKLTTERSSDGVVSVFTKKSVEIELIPKKAGKYVFLERIQDPGNLGTVIRTAAALGIDGVFSSMSADRFSPKATRASMGAVFKMPFCEFRDTASALSFFAENGIKTFAATLSDDSVPISAVDFFGGGCVMIGNEGKGLSALASGGADLRVNIPMRGMESLNASAACTVFIWEMTKNDKTEPKP